VCTRRRRAAHQSTLGKMQQHHQSEMSSIDLTVNPALQFETNHLNFD
jgi:hypothetical protein